MAARLPYDTDSAPTVERELQQARQALDDATKARDAGLSDAAVINRFSYVAFHAVQAALSDRGVEPTSHGGVLSLFGSELIAVGDAPRRDGRFFSQLSELRQHADSGYDELDEDIDARRVYPGRYRQKPSVCAEYALSIQYIPFDSSSGGRVDAC